MATPNYVSGSARLATSRFDFQKHIEGSEFRHNAYNIDTGPTATYPTAAPLIINGVQYYTVADALYALAGELGTDGYSINSFVYRQGSGLTGPVVYGTFAGAVAAANNLGGAAATIFIDDSLGPPPGTIVSGVGNFNLQNIKLVGSSSFSFISGSPTTKMIFNGNITNIWSSVENLILATTSDSPPVYNVKANDVIVMGKAAFIQATSAPSNFFSIVTGSAILILDDLAALGDNTHEVFAVASGAEVTAFANYNATINTNAFGGTGTVVVSESWGAVVSLTQTVSVFDVIYPTITQLQGVPVAPPSGSNTVLTYNAGNLTWGAGGGGGGSVTDSGFFHATSGTLDGVANIGTAGQFALTNAAANDTIWATLSGDVTNSITTAGKITVVGIQTIPVSVTAPTTNQVLSYNGTNWLPTTLPAGSSVTGSGFWHSTGGTLDAAANIGTAGQFALTNAAANNTVWTTLSGDVTNSAGTPGKITVVAIQGNTVTSGALVEGDLLIATSTSNWASTKVTGDVALSATSPGVSTVTGIQNLTVPVPSVVGTVLTYTSPDYTWVTPASGVPGSSFVYKQGSGGTGPVVYGTFAGAVSAANTQGGPCTIIIDNSLGSPTTAAVAYNLEYITLAGYPEQAATLTFITGSSISHIWNDVQNLIIASTSTGTIYTAPANTSIHLNINSLAKSSSAQFFQISNNGCILFMANASVLGDGTHAVVNVASSITFVVIAGAISEIAASSISGSGTTIVETSVSAIISATSGATQVGYEFLGISAPLPSGSNTVLTYNGGAYTWANAGGAVTWANDLAGSSSTHQYIASISGSAGGGGTVVCNINELQFASGQSIPTITQAQLGGTGSTAAQTLTIEAQQGQNVSSGTNNFGGAIFLSSGLAGTGGSGGGPGAFGIGLGGTAVFQITASTSSPLVTGVAEFLLPSLTFASTVGTPNIFQQPISGSGSTAGQDFEIEAQPGQGGSTVGGAGGPLVLVAGAGGSGSVTNGSGANLYLVPGTPGAGGGSAGKSGFATVEIGGINLFQMGYLGGLASSNMAALYTQSGTPSSSNFTLSSDGATITQLNAPGSLGSTQLQFSAGDSFLMGLGAGGIGVGSTGLSISRSTDFVLPAALYVNPLLIMTGTPTGSFTITFPNVAAVWYIASQGIGAFSHTISIQASGGGAEQWLHSTPSAASANVITITTDGSGNIYSSYYN